MRSQPPARWLFLAFVLTTLPLVPYAQAQTPSSPSASSDDALPSASTVAPQIDAVARQALDSLDAVPGMQIAVVQGDSVTYAESFGVRDVSTGECVTNASGFYVASVTKSFTGMLASVLAEADTVDLDAPLSATFPDLAFDSTGLDARRMSLRDHLAHRTGYTNQVLAVRPPSLYRLSVEETVDAVGRYSSPGSIAFNYTNEAYIVAAAALQQATGASWKQLMVDRLFEPLGMTRTTPHMSVARSQQMTAPHAMVDGTLSVIEAKADTNMHAAGGTVSTASDLARWLRAVMHEGRLGGEQVLPADAVREALSMQIRLDARYQYVRRVGYGFGWYHGQMEGERLLHHFGGFRGHHAHTSFLPDRGVGVVVLTNSGIPVPHLVAKQIYDLLRGNDTSARYAQLLQRFGRFVEQRVVAGQRKTKTEWLSGAEPDSQMRRDEAYAGTYVHPTWGTIVVEDGGDALRARYGPRRSAIQPFQQDAFLADWIVGSDLPVRLTFVTHGDRVTGLRWAHPSFDLGHTFERETQGAE